jgi:hypothetical protein
MNPEALCDLMQELGFSPRAEGDSLRVTPAEKLMAFSTCVTLFSVP